MVLLVAGAFVVILGLFCGAVLTLGPLGLVPWTADLALWVLFPVLSIAGFVLFAMAGKTAHVRTFTFSVSCLLLLLALVSAAGLVLSAASVVTPTGSVMSLWYVLAVAGVIGVGGAASSRPAGATA
jgi:hypothetical protein